ncbi:hypothetical protein GQ42DRAFT_38064 [Ramicandelaber brevisporus]|nr:hypothetical protein GQ42DRAFT_38064 [Ramicandelaber brevisporus]
MPFGQLVFGPAGSGKSTYSAGMHQFLNGIGRKTLVVNLDPGNDQTPYECAVDVRDLVSVEDVMELKGLGPNGAMMHCMEFLNENRQWLLDQMADAAATALGINASSDIGGIAENEKSSAIDKVYFIFDCPGQVELYTHSDSLRELIAWLCGRPRHFRLVAVNLIDSHHITDPGKYIAALVLSLRAMLMFELPHVNVLSKIDLIKRYEGNEEEEEEYDSDDMDNNGGNSNRRRNRRPRAGGMRFNLDYYTDVTDLSYLYDEFDDPDAETAAPTTQAFGRRYAALNKVLCDLVERYNLVGFQTLAIEDKNSVTKLMRVIDRANGFVFGGLTPDNTSIMSTAMAELD